MRNNGDQVTLFGPEQIQSELVQAGFDVALDAPQRQNADVEYGSDNDLVLVQRFLRAFLRATALNESTIRQRLGQKASHFFRELLPQLKQAGVVQAVSYQGHGTQGRIRLVTSMTCIENAMSAAGGDFDKFVHEVQRGRA